MRARLVTGVLVLAAFFLGAPTVIRLVGDRGRSLLVLAAVCVPLLVVPLLLVGVVAAALRRRVLAALVAALVVVDACWLVPLFTATAARPGTDLVVMTLNLRFGMADPDAVVRLVRERGVDVLATQELTDEGVRRLQAAGLERVLPYAELRAFRAADGCGLWSRLPLDARPPFEARFQAPGAVVHTAGGDVTVRVLHPFPATLAGGGLYRSDYAAITRQVRALPAGPTVLAGDFNASVDDQALRTLMGSTYRDASEVAGSGVQRTWGPRVGGPALLHLDHVLVRGLGARATEVVSVPNTDHRALLAHLVVPRG